MEKKIEYIKMICQNCGGGLRMTDKNHAVCPYCGYQYLVDEASGTVIYVQTDYGKSKKIRGVILVLPVVLILFLFVAVIFTLDSFENHKNLLRTPNYSVYSPNDGERERPLMELFCEDVFRKSYDEITREELASIQYLSWEGLFVGGASGGTVNTITYSFCEYQDYESEEAFRATTKEWTYNTSYIIDYAETIDCTMLTGLTCIDVRGLTNLSNLRFSSMCNIRSVFASHTLEELTPVISPEKVKMLHIEGKGLEETSLDELGAYTNLEQFLFIDSYALGDKIQLDVSALAKCTQLQDLYLDCGETYVGIEKVKELKQLKSLYLQNILFHQCLFLKEMPQLEELSVWTGYEPDLSMLAYLPNVKILKFPDQRAIDVEALSKLPHLEAVTLGIANEKELEKLYQYSNLKELDVLIRSSTSGSEGDLSGFSRLQNLRTLRIGLDGVAYGVEELLKLPELQRVSLYGGALMIHAEKIPDNHKIEEVSLSDCYLYDAKTMEMIQPEFLTHCSNIQVLKLELCHIEKVDYLTGLTNLEVLDLRMNEICSYAPLFQCKRLKTLYVSESDREVEQKEELQTLAKTVEIKNDSDE